jgi:hypothetical protein
MGGRRLMAGRSWIDGGSWVLGKRWMPGRNKMPGRTSPQRFTTSRPYRYVQTLLPDYPPTYLQGTEQTQTRSIYRACSEPHLQQTEPTFHGLQHTKLHTAHHLHHFHHLWQTVPTLYGLWHTEQRIRCRAGAGWWAEARCQAGASAWSEPRSGPPTRYGASPDLTCLLGMERIQI